MSSYLALSNLAYFPIFVLLVFPDQGNSFSFITPHLASFFHGHNFYIATTYNVSIYSTCTSTHHPTYFFANNWFSSSNFYSTISSDCASFYSVNYYFPIDFSMISFLTPPSSFLVLVLLLVIIFPHRGINWGLEADSWWRRQDKLIHVVRGDFHELR